MCWAGGSGLVLLPVVASGLGLVLRSRNSWGLRLTLDFSELALVFGGVLRGSREGG